MDLQTPERRSIHLEFIRLGSGKYRGTIVVGTKSRTSDQKNKIQCSNDRDTATEAYADAERLANEYQQLTRRTFPFTTSKEACPDN
jgi:hypothetical protein